MRKYSAAKIVGVTAAALVIGLAGGAPALAAPSGIPLEPMVADIGTAPTAVDKPTGSSSGSSEELLRIILFFLAPCGIPEGGPCASS